MKNTLLTLAVLMAASNALAVETCTKYDGAIIYESATTVGNSVVIVNPRLRVAGKEALIAANNPNEYQQAYFGRTFCAAMGMKQGLVSDTAPLSKEPIMIAMFNEDGALIAVSQTNERAAIKTVTCRK